MQEANFTMIGKIVKVKEIEELGLKQNYSNCIGMIVDANGFELYSIYFPHNTNTYAWFQIDEFDIISDPLKEWRNKSDIDRVASIEDAQTWTNDQFVDNKFELVEENGWQVTDANLVTSFEVVSVQDSANMFLCRDWKNNKSCLVDRDTLIILMFPGRKHPFVYVSYNLLGTPVLSI